MEMIERSGYTPEKEIRTVFCVLVIRNQALERLYRGGLGAFLGKHGGRYNDEITALCHSAAEFDLDIADLIGHGLEPKKDFIVFYDDAFGPPVSARDFEHYPFDEGGWLGGYYYHHSVVVFMVN